MKITLPEGYEIPENVKPGQPFEAVATLVASGDGTFELTAIDGTELAPEGEDEEPEMEESMMTGEQRLAKNVRLPWEDDD